MKTGFNILREIMVEGYRPSIARLYDAEDGTQHFTHFADGKCVLIFMAEGNPRIAKVTGRRDCGNRCPLPAMPARGQQADRNLV
ncbi:alkyl-dihydroxyacetonephosphate synthase [Escherichia coli]|nr:alkyl-dihydroxyacetonephosphate synthase [Escherichia coli]